MTQTVQLRSSASLIEAGGDLAGNKSGTEDNTRLFLSVLDSLNKLHETLDRLNNAIQRKKIEQFLCLKKGEKK